jgi:signal transduction histidine kinase
MGLGLTYCKEVVEAHGGSLGVSSGKGVGTVVTIRLPLVSEES